jgi:hypothetical protein
MDPDKQGKPLGEELYDYRSIRVIKQRYRIIYKLKDTKITVLVVTVGIRKGGDKKDVYAVAKKLHRLGLLDVIALPNNEVNEEDKPDERNESDESDRSEPVKG